MDQDDQVLADEPAEPASSSDEELGFLQAVDGHDEEEVL